MKIIEVVHHAEYHGAGTESNPCYTATVYNSIQALRDGRELALLEDHSAVNFVIFDGRKYILAPAIK